MAGRVVLHVGLPKTGTSFLQRVLWDNAGALARHGVRLAVPSRRAMFAAALQVTGRHYEWDPAGVDPQRAWRDVVAGIERTTDTTVLSNEWLSTAPADLAAAARGQLGDDVDLVVTVRDLARQVPAEWQEGVKHGRSVSWQAYLRTVLGHNGRQELRARFWSAQDPLDVIERWGKGLPPERIHLVTCPPPGSDPAILWGRFAQVLGVPADCVELPGRSVNTSLGRAQVEVLRRVNAVFPRKGQEIRHRALVKRYLVRRVLAPQAGERTALPPRWRQRVEDVVADWERRIDEAGYHVVGDLQDLRLRAPTDGEPRRDHDEVLRAFAITTRDLLLEVDSLKRQLRAARRPRTVVGRLRRRLARSGPAGGEDDRP